MEIYQFISYVSGLVLCIASFLVPKYTKLDGKTKVYVQIGLNALIYALILAVQCTSLAQWSHLPDVECGGSGIISVLLTFFNQMLVNQSAFVLLEPVLKKFKKSG